MQTIEVPLVFDGGGGAFIRISVLPGRNDLEGLHSGDSIPTIREASTYRYEVTVPGSILRLEPAELFDSDDQARRSGRLTPREYVGVVEAEVTTSEGVTWRGCFDVRSAKFADESAFGRMLADLAELAVESLHQGFAPSSGQFGAASGPAPQLVYQQFAVLRALLVGSDLSWAIGQVLAQPHREWVATLEPRTPGRPLQGSSRLSTQLSRPGRRVATPLGPLESLPAELLVQRTTETLDTVPNRYVLFLLERWRALADSVLATVQYLPGAAMRRGVHEASRVRDQLDEALGNPLFDEVRRLSLVPRDNQVLLRREGYRQIAAASALIDGSLGLEVNLDDPLLVSRRSIATLYEYWAFTRLASAVAAACGATTGWQGQLFRPSRNGMSLILSTRATSRLKFHGRVDGKEIIADLLFNNEFSAGDSWTRPMRPDASLAIRSPGQEEVWLHFDAKYKVEWSIPFETGSATDEEDAERLGLSKRTDLLKMHAYRDAIRDSAGSYVLFPGSQPLHFGYDDSMSSPEALPGLGAFPLRPDVADEDCVTLKKFLRRAMRHLAGAGTKHRRATFWSRAAYRAGGTTSAEALPPLGALPPADTRVLLGYVRSPQQWEWIMTNHLYNIRAGSRRGSVSDGEPALDAQLLIAYGPADARRVLFRRVGVWRPATRAQLTELSYPHPRGEAYLITRIEEIDSPAWLDLLEVESLRPESLPHGAPSTTTWLDVVLSVQDRTSPHG